MTFGLTSHNDSLLQCEVNVTQGPGLVLSIFHNECKPQTVDSASGDTDAALPYVTLSETIPLRGGGKYECQLHLNENLIVESIFNYTPPGNNLPPDLRRVFMCAHYTLTALCCMLQTPQLLIILHISAIFQWPGLTLITP